MTYPLRGAVAGVLVGLATAFIVADAYRCSSSSFECISVAFRVIAVALVVALLLGWVTLRVLQVREPLRLAGAGMALTLLILPVVGGEAPADPAAMAAMAAGGYAISALALAPRTPRVVQLGFGLLLAAGLVLVYFYHP